MSVFVSLSAVCEDISGTTRTPERRQIFCAFCLQPWLGLLWRRSDALCTCGFVD